MKKDVKKKALPLRRGKDKKDGRATPNTSFSNKSASHVGDHADDALDNDPSSSDEQTSKYGQSEQKSDQDRVGKDPERVD